MEIDPNVRASNVFVEMQGVKRGVGSNFLPPTGLILGQYDQASVGVIDYTPIQLLGADAVGSKFGFGSEIHRQALWVFGLLGGFSDKLWFSPIPEPGGGVVGTGDIAFAVNASTSGTYYFSIGGDVVNFGVNKDATPTEIGDSFVTAITANLNGMVTAANVAGTVTLTSKNKGVNANEIKLVLNPSGVSQEDQNPGATTVAVGEYLTGGSGATDIHDTFFNSSEEDILGDRFYTMISCPYSDATNLGYVDDSWNARKDPGVKRPFGAVVGYAKETLTQALALPATINSEGICPVWESRSYAPAFELSAAVMGIVMESCKLDPGRPFKTLATGIPMDTGLSDLSYAKNDALFKAGMSYFKTVGSEMVTGDLALSYRLNGVAAADDSWFDLVALTLRQQKVYDIEQVFISAPYERGILADDTNISIKPYVIKPKKVIADISALVNSWDFEGWTKNAAEVKASITAIINVSNNSRIDATVTDDEAKALRIVSVLYNFLF
jgi:phage tail sheath gpL-like